MLLGEAAHKTDPKAVGAPPQSKSAPARRRPRKTPLQRTGLAVAEQPSQQVSSPDEVEYEAEDIITCKDDFLRLCCAEAINRGESFIPELR